MSKLILKKVVSASVRCAVVGTVFAGGGVAFAADTLGFWDFRDGESGAVVSEVKSTVGATVFTGTAALSSANGSLPTFSSDSPGRVIVSCRNATELCAAPQSVAFRYPSRTNRQSGLIDIEGLADELVGKGSFTIEFFAKMDEDYRYWVEGDGNYDQISKTMLYLQAAEKAGGFKMIAPMGVINSGDAVGHAKGFGLQTYNHGGTTGGTLNHGLDISDGKWHHIAAVYDETDAEAKTGKLRFYVDYKKINELNYANAASETEGLKFRLGTGYLDGSGNVKTATESINASLSCLRVSTGALAVEDFEVVHEKGKAVFAIGFNETTATEGAQIGTALNTELDLTIYSEVGLSPLAKLVYGLHSAAFPTYDKAKSRVSRNVRWGTRKMWKNLAGCRFLGAYSLSSDTANRQWAGTEFCVVGSSDPVQNPPSWTMEAFVRAEYPTYNSDAVGALLFGKYTANGHQNNYYPQYCWMLTRKHPNGGGNLRLAWTEVKDGDYTSADTDYFKSVETEKDYLGDGAWHHIALSYDQTTRTFTLYVDYQSVLTATVGESGLLDLPYGYYFSRLQCTSGFEGWMDEIRLTNGVLTPEEFETLDKSGFTLTIR